MAWTTLREDYSRLDNKFTILLGSGGAPNVAIRSTRGFAYRFDGAAGGIFFETADSGSTWSAVGAGSTAITDTHNYYAVDTISGATDELALQVGGLTSSTFAFAENNVLANNDALYAALDKLDLQWGDLFSNANGEGLSLVGFEDAGGYYGTADPEAALQKLGSTTGAAIIGISDVAGWYASANTEAALAELQAALGGTDSTTRSYTNDYVVTDNETYFASIDALDTGIRRFTLITNGDGASLVGVEDVGTFYAGANVEAVLAEIPTLVSGWAITDGGGYYTTDTIDGALDALALQIGGLTDATFTFSEANVCTNDTAVYANLEALDLKWGDMASIANGEGASLVAIEDVATYYTAANVEAALAELSSTAIGGTSSGVRAYTNDYAVTDDETLVASIDALDTRLERDAGTYAEADPGTGNPIPVTRSVSLALTIGGGVETNTLANPAWKGQAMTIYADSVGGGSRAITAASSINQATNTIMTFAAARDVIKLEAITVAGGLVWQVTANDGVALS